MEYPRPKKSYWSCCFIYTIIFLVLKFIIQLKVWSQINGFDTFIKYLENYRIGLKLCDNTFSKEFVLYILYDALVLIVLLINNYLLVFDGLFDKREQEVENIYNANERIAMTKDKTFDSVDDMKKFNDEFLLNEENKLELEHKNVIKVFDKLKEDEINEINLGKAKRVVSLPTSKDGMKDLEKKKNLYDESKRGYYESLFPKFRNEKPGKEYYVIYTIAMTLIIIYVFLFYTIMIKDKTFGAVSIETRQFSGEMVLFLLLHIAFLIADRIIYLRQNRKDLKYSYILYDKKQKMIKENKDIDPIAENYPLFKKTETIIPKDYVYKLKDYYIIYIQKETFNRPMFQKYLMHMFIVIFSHIFIFFFMPMYGNYNLNRAVYCTEDSKECNDFIKNTSLPIFYLLYIVYLISSGLQVKYGFYDMKRKSILKGKSNSIYGGIYSAYKSIPFLYEIKLGIDWTFTTTCLDLFQWNKFESVYDVIYTTNCAMTGINAKQVGNTVGKGSKISMGGVLTFVLVLVLVGPMLLFSSLNPTNQLNNLTNSDLTLELSFIYKNELMKNYTLYQNTRPQTIEPINDADWNAYNYSVCVNTKNFPKKQVETVTFSQENDRNWDLSRPHIKNLIELIQSSIKNVSENEDNYITSLNLGDIRTEKVTEFNNMFDTCANLVNINTVNFNFKSAKSLSRMFYLCNQLTSVEINGQNLELNINNINEMFSGCQNLKKVIFKNFKTNKVNTMSYMFLNCKSLEELDITSFSITSVTKIDNMFTNCASITSINLNNFGDNNIVALNGIFLGCSKLEFLDISNLKTTKVREMKELFSGCQNLKSINLNSFDTKIVGTTQKMFENCKSLQKLDLTNFNMNSNRNMESMFNGCENLESIELSNFNTHLVTDMSHLFKNCKKLDSLDLSSFNTSIVINMENV